MGATTAKKSLKTKHVVTLVIILYHHLLGILRPLSPMYFEVIIHPFIDQKIRCDSSVGVADGLSE